MTYVLGIDIGTWTTSAAILRMGGAGTATTFRLGSRSDAAASALFLGRDGRVLAGDAAEREGRGHPERLARGFTRRMGDAVPIVWGERPVPPEELFAAMARWVVTTVEAGEGAPAAAVAVTHPRGWGAYRTSVARRALADAGLAHAVLLSEPEAAALHRMAGDDAAGAGPDPGSLLGVCDLGGGIDATVLRRTAGIGPVPGGTADFEALGRPGRSDRDVGAELDDAVFAHVLGALDGPADAPGTEDPGIRAALSRLRRRCADAKEMLSDEAEVSVPAGLPGVRKQVRIARAEVEAMAVRPLREATAVLGRALESANVAPDELDAIVLTGGPARMPVAERMFAEAFGGRVAVDADPVSVTARGAAVAAAGHYTAGVGTQAVVATVLAVRGPAARQEPHDLGWLAPAGPSGVEAAGILYLPVRPRRTAAVAPAPGE